jgi:inorganic triphosphatase YgiF
MGAEYELKYRADTDCLKSVYTTFPARWQTIHMETTYYDTLDSALSSRKFMLRCRLENDKRVCTLKTPGEHNLRGEWETECGSITAAIPELCKLGAPEELVQLCRKGLVPICGARFTRKAGTFSLRECVLELALDEGVLFGNGKEIPLCEIEVELKSGAEEAAIAFAQELSANFHLQPQPKSKFARAMELAFQQTEGR